MTRFGCAVIPQAVATVFAAVSVMAPIAWSSTPEDEITSTLVKVYTISNPPDQESPWQRTGTEQSSGSGVIISGNQILTNAHVVTHQVSVEVKKFGSTTRYTAEVKHLGHECDLAILTVSDPAFFSGVTPLALGELPEIQQQVHVYGFPLGGEMISVTSGVVSRIEVSSYAQSLSNLLTMQIDAAINAGNSGGPVVSDNKLVGIAMQTLVDTENIGYTIPVPVIQHFLDDILDRNFDGFPHLGAETQSLENPGLRRFLKMSDTQSGVLVGRVNHGSSAWDHLRFGDVILEIDGAPVANDKTIAFRGYERVSFTHLNHMKQVGESITLTLLRDGEQLIETLTLNNSPYLIPSMKYPTRPSYLVFGGLVFQQLTIEYIINSDYTSEDLWNHALFQNIARPDRREIILLSKVLAAPLNTGYHDWEDMIVSTINGVIPRDMAHLAQLIDTATDPWLQIHTEDGGLCVLNVAEARQANAKILDGYGISEDRSPDLRAVVGMATAND